jgi:hypothetical protein
MGMVWAYCTYQLAPSQRSSMRSLSKHQLSGHALLVVALLVALLQVKTWLNDISDERESKDPA